MNNCKKVNIILEHIVIKLKSNNFSKYAKYQKRSCGMESSFKSDKYAVLCCSYLKKGNYKNVTLSIWTPSMSPNYHMITTNFP